eukprot:2095673-Rhodomonas_salina.1
MPTRKLIGACTPYLHLTTSHSCRHNTPSTSLTGRLSAHTACPPPPPPHPIALLSAQRTLRLTPSRYCPHNTAFCSPLWLHSSQFALIPLAPTPLALTRIAPRSYA